MTKEVFFHDWLVTYLQGRLARDYKEIQANYQDDQQHEFNGHFPDLILANQGMVLAIMEMRRARTTIIPHLDPKALIAGGIFRYTRNPIYLADVLILLGIFIVFTESSAVLPFIYTLF